MSVIRDFALSLAALTLLCGCQTPTEFALGAARASGLAPTIVPGARFRHQVVEAFTSDRSQLLVLIEGDGKPWILGGTLVARDPSPRRPLMLRLTATSPLSTLYVGRPCYFDARRDPDCEKSLWTSARYSQQVVESIGAVIDRVIEREGFRSVILAGHSGGGTLALLVARRVPLTAAVITLAANLDVDAWIAHHHYLPLRESLNPARLPPLAPHIEQWHAVGERDRNVPPAINARYWASVPAQRLLRYPQADHNCCWENLWPGILELVRRQLDRP